MNTNYLEGEWQQVKGHIKKNWGKLTDNDLKVIEGNRDMLYGKLLSAYGWSKEEAQKEVKKVFG